MIPVAPCKPTRVQQNQSNQVDDLLAVEEPLEIRLGYGAEADRQQMSLSVTMRTPGNDQELCLGFLFTEGIISGKNQISSIRYCASVEKEEEKENVMRVELIPEITLDPDLFQRNFYTTSSCGVCGKSSIEAIEVTCQRLEDDLRINSQLLYQFPEKLEAAQDIFKHTGGLHAAAVFDQTGNLLVYREDVGRHNALDKLIGHMLLNNIEADSMVLQLSGRLSFELVQKAVRMKFPIAAAIGAPSSLAVELSKRFGQTLVGFLKSDRFNIYSNPSRITY